MTVFYLVNSRFKFPAPSVLFILSGETEWHTGCRSRLQSRDDDDDDDVLFIDYIFLLVLIFITL